MSERALDSDEQVVPEDPRRLARRLWLRLPLALTALSAAVTGSLPLVFGLAAPGAEGGGLRAALWSLPPAVGLTTLLLVVGATAGARRADAPTRARVRRRLLLLPLRVTLVVLACAAGAFAATAVALAAAGLPSGLLAGLLVATLSVLALLPVPSALVTRVLATPLAVAVGDETLPDVRRTSIGTVLGGGLVSVAVAALLPAAVVGQTLLERAAVTDARAAAAATAGRLARAAADLDAPGQVALIASVPLASGRRALVRAPSGALLPEGVSAPREAVAEAPLPGALRGGAVLVPYSATPSGSPALLLATLALLALSLATAIIVGRDVARELEEAAERLDRVAEDAAPPPSATPPATAEVRAITRAVNRLLSRIPRFTIESFLAIERAEEAQRLKSRFLANMSHDLRSPLNSILGFSELLLRGIEGPITPGQKVELELISARGHELLRLLNQILDTAKLESGRLDLHRQTIPPAELVRAGIAESLRGRAPEIADRLDVQLQPGLPAVWVDPLRITQVVTHLLDHALAATSAGRIRLGVEVREPGADEGAAGARGRFLCVEVGLPGAEAAAAAGFEPFQVAGEAAPGTAAAGPLAPTVGLNLALPLARKLVELHGGAVEAVPAAPGLRLRARIPLVPPALALRQG